MIYIQLMQTQTAMAQDLTGAAHARPGRAGRDASLGDTERARHLLRDIENPLQGVSLFHVR